MNLTLLPCRSARWYFKRTILTLFVALSLQSIYAQPFPFSSTGLSGESLNNPTSLDFGPNGKLYVSQQNGEIHEYTIERDNAAPGNGSYTVTNAETINLVKNNTPNHNDDGIFNTTQQRQVTGLLATGTAANPVLYVTSSDWRIAVGNDSGLDTNSGVISRLTWNGSNWEKVDIVRGLSRCEENHSINGLDLDESSNTLYVMVGGNTNKGAPGNNFSGTPEFWFAGALITVDLDAIDAMTVYNDPRSGGTPYVYDLPTLNDPNRTDIDNTHGDFPYTDPGHPMHNASIDLGDPFGGNNGANMAIPEPGGPVQVYSGGYRNAYDVVLTQNGKLFSSDNGPNGGWGGLPLLYDDTDTPQGMVTSAELPAGWYITNEFNENGSNGHGDVLYNIQGGGYYGGHPAPVRAFPKKSRIIIYEKVSGTWTEINNYDFENLLVGASGYFNPTLDISMYPDKPQEAPYYANDLSKPGQIDVIGASTNGITEYTASNFNGDMQGHILTASFNGNIYRYKISADGNDYDQKEAIFSGFGSQPLDVTAQGDGDVFPGTIWAATYGADNITIFEPDDFGNCPQVGDDEYDDPNIDSDGDGFSNFDEVSNGTNICSGGSTPPDNDGDMVSDLLDDDDDNDGILDPVDNFAIDADNGLTTTIPISYPFTNANPGTGFFGVGFTGLMTNSTTDYLNQFDDSILSFGGAAGKVAIEEVSAGDAYEGANNQDNGFQFGVNNGSEAFTVHSKLESPYFADPTTGNAQTPVDFQSWGIFIGPGDQNNYLKMVFNANGGDGGIQVLLEVGASATSATTYGSGTIGDILNSDAVDLYLTCDPATNEVQPYVSLDGGINITTLGSPVTVPAGWFDQNDSQALAVGIISTSTGSGAPFNAIWDFINVLEENNMANLAAENPPVDFGQVIEGTSTVTQELRVINQGGPSAGSINITAINFTGTDNAEFEYTGPLPINVGPGNTSDIILNFNPGAIGIKSANVELTHSGDNSPLIVPIQAEVVEDFAVLYRVNVGGAAQTSLDAPNPDWEVDTNGDPSPYRNAGSNVANTSANSLDPSVPAYVPAAIWSQERWDPSSGEEMQWDFPADISGEYIIRLFFLNNCTCTQNVGERVFDVLIEGNAVLDDYDIVADVGHKVGVMKEFQVTVNDGNLDIDFQRVVENPVFNGIEILGPSGSVVSPPIVIDPVSDQTNLVDDTVNLPVNASGGTVGESFTFDATGLPDGLQIEPSTGLIFGTIGQAASDNSPYTVTVTASKPSDDPAEIMFTWTIATPGDGDILYRVNCGGPEVTDTDLNWSEDQAGPNGTANGSASSGTPSPYLNLTGATDQDLTFGGTFSGTNNTSVPDALFTTERYNTFAGTTDNMQYDFPVQNGTYEVNLVFAEIWTGAQDPGVRVFDIEVEGELLEGYDITADVGWQTPAIKTFIVDVTDGNLDVNLIKDVQNPALKGIEVRSYDTVNDQWVLKNEAQNYTARHECSFVQAGDKFYLFGGREDAEVLDTYDYGSDTWTTSATAPAEFNHFQAVEYQGLIWVIGAFKDNDFPNETPADFIHVYDPANDVWMQGPEIPAGRKRGSAGLVVYNDKFYVICGNNDGHDGGYIPWFDEYDPQTNTWTSLTDAPHSRDHFHAAVNGDLLFVVGGRLSGGDGGTFAPLIPEVDVYDFTTGMWTTLPMASNLPTPRAAAGVVNYQGRIYVIGGEGNGQAYATTESIDPIAYTWETHADMNNPRHGTQGIVSGNGIFITAGSPIQGGGQQKNMECYGGDIPAGAASVASILDAPTEVDFAANSSEVITISAINGTEGIFVTSMEITGTDAADFSFVSGDLEKFLVPLNGNHDIEIAFNSSELNKTATLEINYGAAGTVTVDLLGPTDLEPSMVLYRINVGGPQVAAADASAPDWSIDNATTASVYRVAGSNTLYNGNAGSAHTGPIIMTHPSIPPSAPQEMFNTERYDTPAAPEMKWEFPIDPDTDIEVRLFFAELFGDITAAGQRVFDVTVEGTTPAAFTDIDAFAIAGAKGASMLSTVVTVNDGTLDLEFIHNIENPALKGIEIISIGSQQNNPPVVTNPGDQFNDEGDSVNLPIMADDGDNNSQTLTYSADGLPPSLIIDTNTGVISGVIDEATMGGSGAFLEENGWVVVEIESIPPTDDWDDSGDPNDIPSPIGGAIGTYYEWQHGSTFGGIIQPGQGVLTYPIEIVNPGLYRFQWRSAAPNSTEHNDSWLKVEGGNSTAYAYQGNPNSPTATVNLGNSYFKVYQNSGGDNWSWTAHHVDNNAHQIYMDFPEAGTYNIVVSARSTLHKLDRFALYSIDLVGNNQTAGTLDGQAQSDQATASMGGAAENSPYNVTVTVMDNGVPVESSNIDFIWYVNAPNQSASLDGSINTNVCEGENLTIWLYEAGTNIEVRMETVSLGANGTFSMSSITPGTYDVFVKMDNSLKKGLLGQTFGAGNTESMNFGDLLMGDCDNNNAINIQDFSILGTSFNKVSGETGYDDRADFDCNDAVNISDFSMLGTNFNQVGDEPQNGGN